MIYEKICPKLNTDARGSLFEVYSKLLSYSLTPKHMYISKSTRGVIRGFHQQLENPQKKLIFCLSGNVADYGLNIDPFSSDFGSVNCHMLTGATGEGVIIGCDVAHGFESLSDECTMLYICDDDYSPIGQLNINPLDEAFNSIWKTTDPIISVKDREGKSLQEAKKILLNKLRK